MPCQLCGNTSELRNSHIIPELFYTGLYDTLHRFHVIPADHTKPEKFQQKGVREKLLCDTCEQRFSRWEKYASEAFVYGNGLRITQRDEEISFQGLDYKKFKLFLMSVLWRMGVSTLDLFKDVDLGDRHEKALRAALLNDDPLGESQYSCLLVALFINGKAYKDWMLEPTHQKTKGQHSYWLVINGILYWYFVSNQPMPAEFQGAVLKKNGEMLVLQNDVVNIPVLWDAMQKLGKGIKLRKQQPR